MLISGNGASRAALFLVALTMTVGGGCFQSRSVLRSAGAVGVPRAGVYVTATDFEHAQLASAIECANSSDPIPREAFASDRVIDLPGAADGAPRARFARIDVFGFRACDGSEVRFVGNENYRVLRAPPLYLYERARRVPAGKVTQLVYEHYFSTTAADSLRPLTLVALKAAYPKDHRFHDLLDLAFHDDDELLRYDDFHHEYRVARILRETLP